MFHLWSHVRVEQLSKRMVLRSSPERPLLSISARVRISGPHSVAAHFYTLGYLDDRMLRHPDHFGDSGTFFHLSILSAHPSEVNRRGLAGWLASELAHWGTKSLIWCTSSSQVHNNHHRGKAQHQEESGE